MKYIYIPSYIQKYIYIKLPMSIIVQDFISLVFWNLAWGRISAPSYTLQAHGEYGGKKRHYYYHLAPRASPHCTPNTLQS